MAEKLPYVLEILTATEVPCKGWQVHVDTEGGNRTWAQTRVKALYIWQRASTFFPLKFVTRTNTFSLEHSFFYLSCGKTLVLHTKESTHELTVFFPRTQLTTVSVGQGNCSFSYYLGPVCLKFDRFYPDYQSKLRTDKNAHTPIL